MIDRVTFAETTYLDPPTRFEAGTPHIVGAVGLHAAIDWVEGLSLDAIHAHECALVAECRAALSSIGGVSSTGRKTAPESSASTSTGCIRTTPPPYWMMRASRSAPAIIARSRLMDVLGVPATARASFAAHSDSSDIEALVRGIEQVKRIFG